MDCHCPGRRRLDRSCVRLGAVVARRRSTAIGRLSCGRVFDERAGHRRRRDAGETVRSRHYAPFVYRRPKAKPWHTGSTAGLGCGEPSHSVVDALFGAAIFGLALLGIPFVAGLGLEQNFLTAFAMSFSSTVFAVKVLEERGEMVSLHSRIDIGILIVQDLAAVIFLAISTGKLPSPWAVSILLLIPLRPVLLKILERVGHGELLVLHGFSLALGGAEAFELVGMKGDLGALILDIMIANHAKADELSKNVLGFKDLFLLGFFLSISLSGPLSAATVVAAVIITPLILLKSSFFFALIAALKPRARMLFFASLNSTNFSELRLIVATTGVANDWLCSEWLIVLAIAMSLSFAVGEALNATTNWL